MPSSEFIIDGDELKILRLSLRNKIELKLFGRSKLTKLALNQSWRGRVQFYVFKCERHGIVANYSHHYEQVLDCPVCQRLLDPNSVMESSRNLFA